MASTDSQNPDFATYAIVNTSIPTATAVSLSAPQRLLVGSVLDLFAQHPSKRKLTLWADDAVFADPLTIAEGRAQFEAQWYGLKAAFSTIERQHCLVTSGGNPVEMEMRNKYKVKGIGSEQVVESKIKIYTSQDGTRITKVEDRWDDKLPDGGFKTAMRNLNSVVVPKLVSVPKSVEEEEAAMKKA